ncbi:MAG: hypothetical protein JNJ94_12105 [Chlorobi bacterium]|nr:hypothetical protein [Chlorobiota bacterium]
MLRKIGVVADIVIPFLDCCCCVPDDPGDVAEIMGAKLSSTRCDGIRAST